MEAGKKAAIGAGVFVDADGEDGDVGAVVMELHEGWGFPNAGRALAPPEIQKYDFAAIVGKMDGVFAIAHCEIGGNAVGICRCCSAVAGSCAGEQQQRAEDDETRKAHILIIRSGRDRKEGWLK